MNARQSFFIVPSLAHHLGHSDRPSCFWLFATADAYANPNGLATHIYPCGIENATIISKGKFKFLFRRFL
jgi:hypothetical protein